MDHVRCISARPFVVMVICLASTAGVFAQGGSGTLTGTVVDTTGAAIPGAAVSATDANTGSVRTIVSDEVGLFRMAALNPGRYVVSVELAGFSTAGNANAMYPRGVSGDTEGGAPLRPPAFGIDDTTTY